MFPPSPFNPPSGFAGIGRIVATIIDGAWAHWAEAYVDGTWEQVTDPSSAMVTGDPEGLGATGSGVNLTWPDGTAIMTTSVQDEAQFWAIDLSQYDLPAASRHYWTVRLLTSGLTVTGGGVTEYSYLLTGLAQGTPPATLYRAVGLRRRTDTNLAPAIVTGPSALPAVGSAGATILGVQAPLHVPLTTAAQVYVSSLNASDGVVTSFSDATAPTLSSGAPTHLTIYAGCLVGCNATVVSAPRVELYV